MTTMPPSPGVMVLLPKNLNQATSPNVSKQAIAVRGPNPLAPIFHPQEAMRLGKLHERRLFQGWP